MKRPALHFVLILSLALNLGVIGAVGYRTLQRGELSVVFGDAAKQPGLADVLKLSAEQRRRWHELEAGFLRDLDADWKQIRPHRENMIHEIFSGQPDRNRIEAERSLVAQLQAKQQQRVIEQLLKERAMLDPGQQRALVEILLQQAPAGGKEEQLHRR